MEETYLSWNLANWITIVLMAAIGFAILALIQKFIQSRTGATDASS